MASRCEGKICHDIKEVDITHPQFISVQSSDICLQMFQLLYPYMYINPHLQIKWNVHQRAELTVQSSLWCIQAQSDPHGYLMLPSNRSLAPDSGHLPLLLSAPSSPSSLSHYIY